MDASGTIIGVIIGGAFTLAGSLWPAYMNRNSEERKQKLQFDHSKIQMIFEDRKASCIKIIDEINRALKMIRLNQAWEEEWKPIKEEQFETTREAFTKEFLFSGEKAEIALKLFLEIMSDTVLWDCEKDATYDPREKDKMIRRAFDELEFLSQHITNFLRSQIYLIKEEPLILSKVALLEACRFVSDSRFDGLKFTDQEIIKMDGVQMPMDIVQLAENNLALFKNEFVHCLRRLKENPFNYRDTEKILFEIGRVERLLVDL